MGAGLADRLESIETQGGIRGRDIAVLLRTTPETVSRWKNGHVEPQPTHRDNLLRLEWLISELSELYQPENAKLWLYSPNKLLNGDRPADRIQNGQIEDVLTVIAQLKDGAFV